MRKIALLLTMCILIAVMCAFPAVAATYSPTEGLVVSRVSYSNEVSVREYNGTDSKVILPNDTTMIAQSAFFKNQVAVSIYLPKSVKDIGFMAFYGSTVKYLYLESSTPPERCYRDWETFPTQWETSLNEDGITVIYNATIEDMLNGTAGGNGGSTNDQDYINAFFQYQNLAEHAKSLNPDNYTPESWANLQNALSFDPTGKTTGEIKQAIANLQIALDAMERLENATVILGDVNLNGKIDARDYLLLKRAYFGTYTLTNNSAGDINRNGKIDARDYLLLKRAYFGTYSIG